MPRNKHRASKQLQVGIAVAAVAATVVALFIEHALVENPPYDQVLGLTVWVAWVVGPPLWFLWDWSCQDGMKVDSVEFQEFRYSQELASKVCGSASPPS
jgi:hypothetical protein